MFCHVDVHFRRRDSHVAARNAGELFTQIRNQIVNHLAAAVQLPVTHH